jgi:UDP-glucose 4-epimerase
MKILVTGGSGFLGSHVADELSKRGHEVIIFDKKKSKWVKKNQKFIIGNILDVKKINKAIKGVKIIFHIAALADLEDALHKPVETVKNNILGTVNILEIARTNNIKRVIYASSIYSTSIQGGFYRCSKRAAEDYIDEYYKRYGISFTILRYGSLYGERATETNGIFRILNKAIRTKKVEYAGNRSSIRKYINIFDAAKASADVISNKYKNKYINIVGTKSYKVLDLLKIVSKLVGSKKKIFFLKKKALGHYIKLPKKLKIKKGTNFRLKNSVKLQTGLKDLINSLS